MKSKIFIFTTLILVLFLFVITSCDNFLNAQNKTTININLDLSKILKTSRNETTTIPTDYILKVFAYNAATYKPKDEIQNLPLLTQTENKVDINGNVKASLDVEIGLNVIFVAKLYQGKSEKPLYAGKSEVIKINATDNKVHLVLTKTEVHEHTFSAEWSFDETEHWHSATCGHTEEVGEKAEHIFNWQVTKEASCTEKGEKKGTCTTCGYEKTEITDKVEHTFGIWEVETAPTSTTEGTSKRICSTCNFEETKSIIAIPENFALIPAGNFKMGSTRGNSNTKPVHDVIITKSFYMGKYEVTQAEYEKYCTYGNGSSSPNSDKGDGDNYPAYYVSWYDAIVYCNKRSISEGLTPCYSISDSIEPIEWGTVPTSDDDIWNAVVCNWDANGYRLPTEAEREYAARAGDSIVDSFTYSGTSDVNELGEYAWYSSNSDNATHEVGIKAANAFGLYDMSGNVWEWCWNRYTDSYDTNTEGGNDPTGVSVGSNRVIRGGGWNHDSGYCSVSCRAITTNGPYACGSTLGFRLVRASSN